MRAALARAIGLPSRGEWLAAAGAILGVALVTVPSAASGVIRSGAPAPVVPHNDLAVIFNLFGSDPRDRATLATVAGILRNEGYRVESFVDVNEGAGGPGGATVDNFTTVLPRASVIVVNTHGTDPTGRQRGCPSGKGIYVQPQPPPAGGATPLPLSACAQGNDEPVLQVQWYPTYTAELTAYNRLLARGLKASWLFAPPRALEAPTLVPPRNGDDVSPGTPFGRRPWLGLTASGIAHFFAGHQIDLVDNLACHSIVFASAFDARTYFGHSTTACDSLEAKDEPVLFNRLAGRDGVPARDTIAAYGEGGFVDPDFVLAPGADPVVLSPAVESVDPEDGTKIIAGSHATLKVRFDATMTPTPAADMIEATGCGAKITGGSWSDDDSLLTFKLRTRKSDADERLTLTIDPKRAVAPGGGDNDLLDGDQAPSPRSGEIPNDTKYEWQLTCAGNANLSFTITYGGTYSDHAADTGNVHVDDLQMSWHEVLNGTIGKDGRVVASPVQLTLNGTVTVENNVEGQPPNTATCSLVAGRTPIEPGGFINITPGAAPTNGSLLSGFRTFKAWASIPLTVPNGEAAYATGASGLCQRGDLRPYLAATAYESLPPSWNAAALAETSGTWGKQLRLTRNASFSMTSPDRKTQDTVKVQATMTVSTNGTLTGN